MSVTGAPVSQCQQRLAVVWFLGSALVLILMLGQTIGGKYGTQYPKAWSWFLPTVLPTLSLIVGALAHDARRQTAATVNRFAYQMSLALSLFYLLLVVGTILLQPLAMMNPLELLSTSHLWLGPLQGLIGISLGVFFGSRRTP